MIDIHQFLNPTTYEEAQKNIEILDDIMFEQFRVINIRKVDEDKVNPLTVRGFLTLEKLLSVKLIKLTSPFKQASKSALNSLINKTNFPQLSERQKEIFTRKALEVINKYGLNASKVLPPEIQQSAIKILSRTKEVVANQMKAEIPFTLKDKKAIQNLTKYNSLFIRENFQNNITKSARNIIVEDLKRHGGSRVFAARALKENLGDLIEETDNYWKVVAGANLNTARSKGLLESFSEVDVTEYQILSVLDERTTRICQDLHGTTFKVSDGLKLFGKLEKASSPEQFKKLSPWVHTRKDGTHVFKSGKSKKTFSSSASSSYLSGNGIMFPPFHGNCRSTVVIVE